MLFTISGACSPIVPESGAPSTVGSETPRSSVIDSVPTPTTSTTDVEASTTSSAPPASTAGVIVGTFGVLGWWDGDWREADDASLVPAIDGATYTLVGPTGIVGAATGSIAEPGCGVVPEHVVMTLDPDPFLGMDLFSSGPVAVSAAWDVAPHAVASLTTDSAVYGDIVREHLAGRGFEVQSPQITQLYRTDLEGDGVDEVVIVADNHNGEFFGTGVYSVILVRKLVEGEVQTAVLHESIVGEGDEFPFSVTARVSAIADLNGDGTSELVIDDAYYEGAGTQVFEYVDDDLGFVPVLLTGCGA